MKLQLQLQASVAMALLSVPPTVMSVNIIEPSNTIDGSTFQKQILEEKDRISSAVNVFANHPLLSESTQCEDHGRILGQCLTGVAGQSHDQIQSCVYCFSAAFHSDTMKNDENCDDRNVEEDEGLCDMLHACVAERYCSATCASEFIDGANCLLAVNNNGCTSQCPSAAADEDEDDEEDPSSFAGKKTWKSSRGSQANRGNSTSTSAATPVTGMGMSKVFGIVSVIGFGLTQVV